MGDFQKDLVPVMINFGRCGQNNNPQDLKMDLLFGYGNATNISDPLYKDIDVWNYDNWWDYSQSPEDDNSNDASQYANYSVLHVTDE